MSILPKNKKEVVFTYVVLTISGFTVILASEFAMRLLGWKTW